MFAFCVMNSIVISIGGSVLFSDDATRSYLNKFVRICTTISKNNHLFLVVGGGKPAREYIKRGRFLEFSERDLDELGILVTRINALFLTKLFDNTNTAIPSSIEDASQFQDRIVIMGGTTPGHSTDFVGAELAARTRASKYIIATNVDGIFDKDPNKYEDAVMYPEIRIDALLNKYGSSWNAAGSNIVIDGPALKQIAAAKIDTVVINGKKLDELEHVLSDKSFCGTKIKL